jgi:hypothetical protein
VVVRAVAATLVKAAPESSAVIQGGESPVAEQDENDDSAKRDEVRIATPAIILLLILGRARIHAITLKWGLRFHSEPWQDISSLSTRSFLLP